MSDPASRSAHPAPPVPAPEPAFFDNPAIDNLIAETEALQRQARTPQSR